MKKINIVGEEDHMGESLSVCLVKMGNRIVSIEDANVCWIAIDTPVDDEGRGIIKPVIDAIIEAKKGLKKGSLMVVSSQIPVGTSKEIIKILGKDYGYAYMPELMKIGSGVDDFMSLKQVFIGVNEEKYKNALLNIFKGKKVNFVNVPTAEMIKHSNNAFLATSLCFIYDIADICKAVGADVTDVSKALRADYRIGQEAYLDASAGFSGGHLERDLDYLNDVAQANGVQTPVINAVWRKNLSRREIVHMAIGDVKNKTVAFWGMTYKPGVPMSNNSLPAKLMRDILKLDGKVAVSDPSIKGTPYDSVKGAAAIVCITPWKGLKKIDFKKVSKLMKRPKVLFDARNYFKDMEDEIKKAGIKYVGVGR